MKSHSLPAPKKECFMKYLGKITDPKDLVTKEYSDSFICSSEYSTTASKAYSVGDYFIYNKLIYQVTAAIASGGLINPGTNCILAGDLSEIIKSRVKEIDVTFATTDFVSNNDSTISAAYVGTKTVTGLNTAFDYDADLSVSPNSISTVLTARFLPINKMNAGVLYVYCNILPTASITFHGKFTQV